MKNSMMTEVCAILRRVASEYVLPHFRALRGEDVYEKSVGEPVTIADRAAEAALAEALALIEPAALFIGEEACAADPALRLRIGDDLVWLVDPIDGTANFAAGRAPFAIMVALLRQGVTQAAWVLDPLTDVMSLAHRGDGSWHDDIRLEPSDDLPADTKLTGIVSTAFVPPEQAEIPALLGDRVGTVLPTKRCAGHEYPLIARGGRDFAIYWRTLPWDHVPGVLLVEEAGGVVIHLDGTAYDPRDERPGLLVARNKIIAARLLEIMAR